MYVNVKPLDKKVHQNLKYAPVKGYRFAEALPAAVLSHLEMAHASRYYPIVFLNGGDDKNPWMPHALLTLQPKKNAFITDDGVWAAGYIPMYVRRYPFILGRSSEANKFTVMIDESAPQFQGDKGTPLFDAAGEPGDILKRAIAFLQKYNKDFEITRLMVQEIEKNDLLIPMKARGGKDGPEKILAGFRTIDFRKMLKLDDATLAGWVRKGIMPMINAHLTSLANFNALAKLQGIRPVPRV